MLAPRFRRWPQVAALGAAWCLLAPFAAANTGLPMLGLVWPASWILFLPIVLVEAFVCARVLPVPYRKALWMTSVANAFSTLVGIPVTWFLLVGVQIGLPGSSFVGPEASLDNVLSLVRNAAWLSPTEPVPTWNVTTSALALCVPFYFVSVWTEGFIVGRCAPKSIASRAFRSSWRANLATYGPIGLALLVLSITAARTETVADDEPAAADDMTLEEWTPSEVATSRSSDALESGERTSVTVPAETETAVEPSFHLRVLRAPENVPVDEVVFRATAKSGAWLVRGLSGAGLGLDAVPHGGGLFELRLPTYRPHAICVEAPGCSVRALFVERANVRPEDAATVRLERSSAISARLAGDGFEGARLLARTAVRGLIDGVPVSEDPDLAESSWSAAIDAAGRAELAGLPPRVPLDLTVERDGACLHRRSEPIVLGGTSVVLGRMVDEHDVPVADREVWLVEVDPRFLDDFDSGTEPLERATTGPDGGFRFGVVREGRWRIGPAFVRGAAVVRGQVLRVDVGARPERIEVTLRVLRGSFVSGIVLDEQDRPVASCVVHADPGTEARIWTRTDERGQFRLGPLTEGSHALVAGSAGSGPWSESPPLDVLAGTSGVVLRVGLGAALLGRLVDSEGEPLRDGRVEVTQLEGGVLEGAWQITVNRGAFDLRGLEAGTYDLLAVAQGARTCSVRVELEAGEQRELELRLAEGATLAIESREDAAVLVELRAGGRFVGLHRLARGDPLRAIVPAGALEVRFFDSERRPLATRELELRAGETREIAYPAP